MSEVKNLATKLVRVMSNIKRVAKNGTNSFHNYQYATESDILEAVRDVLAKENIFVFSSVIGTDKNGDMTSVVMQHTFVDADSGETFEVKSFGQGQDKGDKGGNKAITAATKYMLMKCFMIPTGDDPEATDETGKSTAPKVRTLVATDSGVSTASVSPKKYGFSGKAKTVAAPTLVEGADEF